MKSKTHTHTMKKQSRNKLIDKADRLLFITGEGD